MKRRERAVRTSRKTAKNPLIHHLDRDLARSYSGRPTGVTSSITPSLRTQFSIHTDTLHEGKTKEGPALALGGVCGCSSADRAGSTRAAHETSVAVSGETVSSEEKQFRSCRSHQLEGQGSKREEKRNECRAFVGGGWRGDRRRDRRRHHTTARGSFLGRGSSREARERSTIAQDDPVDLREPRLRGRCGTSENLQGAVERSGSQGETLPGCRLRDCTPGRRWV